ncbi:MAG: cadherin-like beta sandwich domain-containing protein, partial [Deltaproteobacteria bacterium]|nr:cadherin-like beta sandwich domain-containing protein [Deltaproteobacteria bacterium]
MSAQRRPAPSADSPRRHDPRPGRLRPRFLLLLPALALLLGLSGPFAAAPAKAQQSSDATLSDLYLSANTLSYTGNDLINVYPLWMNPATFSPTTTSYTAAVLNDITVAVLMPFVNDPDATVKVGKGSDLRTVESGKQSHRIPLSEGANALKVEVTAADGTTKKTYTVTVTRHAVTWDAFESVDSPFVGLYTTLPDSANDTVTEGSSVTFEVELSRAPSSDVRIPFTWSLNSAESADLSAASRTFLDKGEVIVKAGEYVATFTVATQHDADAQGERFTVSIDVANLPEGYTPYYQTSITIWINDDETLKGKLPPLSRFLSGPISNSYFSKYYYTATVPYDVTEIFVDWAESVVHRIGSVRRVWVNGEEAGAPVRLGVGENTIVVKLVTADHRWTTTHEVRVAREPRPASSDLSMLWVEAATYGVYSALDIGAFAAGTTSYAATVPYGTTHARLKPAAAAGATVKAGKGNSLTTVASGSASGDIELSVGANELKVEITAGGRTKTYTVTVTREAPSSNADLMSLSSVIVFPMDGGRGKHVIVGFQPRKTSYTATVPYEMTNVSMEAFVRAPSPSLAYLTERELADVPVFAPVKTVKADKGTTSWLGALWDGPSRRLIKAHVNRFALSVGANVFKFEVTAEDGTTKKTYTVTLMREESGPSSADLSGLRAEAGAGGAYSALDIGRFAAGTTSYTATVPYTTTHARLTPTAGNSRATVKAGAGSELTAVASGSAGAAVALSEGANALKVEVTSADGTTKKTYTVTVTREGPSSNADLSSLTATKAG